jgi:hypothetical protein
MCCNKIVHPNDSFVAYHIQKIGNNFLEQYWDEKNSVDPFCIAPFAHKLILVKCPDNPLHPSYSVLASKFSVGRRCPYCSHTKLTECESVGFTHPHVIDLWPEKNETTPYQHHATTKDVVWWKCENGEHDDYQRCLGSSLNSLARNPIGFRRWDEWRRFR